MANRKGTLKALASELNLSVTTVSRALAGYSDVAENTRKRIEKAAKRANYVPNSAGKMLVTGRSGFIGLLLPIRGREFMDPFLGEFVAGLSEGLVERGRDLFLATAPGTQSEITVLKHVVESGRADGMVLTRVMEQDERVDYLKERQFPYITHGRTLATEDAKNWVDTDGEQAFADAFRLLYELGHRRIGLISISEPMTFRYFRELGLESAISQCGDPGVTLTTQHVPRFDQERRKAAIMQMLTSHKRPTAILALTDEIALSVLDISRQLDVQVPSQLSVIGFDNIPAAGYAPPGLTTFDQSIQETAQQIASMLLDVIEQKTTHQHRLVRPTLIRRASHGPAPHHPP